MLLIYLLHTDLLIALMSVSY